MQMPTKIIMSIGTCLCQLERKQDINSNDIWSVIFSYSTYSGFIRDVDCVLHRKQLNTIV